MDSDHSYFGPPHMTSDLGHVAWQATTVNPTNLLLVQPPLGLTQSSWIPDNVTSTDAMRHLAIHTMPEETLQHHPTAWASPSKGHTLGQFSAMCGIPAGHTGASVPIGRMSRGLSKRCQWLSSNGFICDHLITDRTVPKHLAEHGIRGMHKDLVVQCFWRGCGLRLKRGGITRHCREVHLASKRKSPKQAVSRGGLDN